MTKPSSSHEMNTGDDLVEALPVGVDDTSSRLSVFNFEKLLEDHPSLAKYNPVMATKNDRANRTLPGKVALYQAYFTPSNLRLPLNSFYLEVLAHYKIGLAQVQPVGAGKVLLFEMILAGLGLPKSLSLFRKFFRLVTTGDWFTFTIREWGSTLISGIPSAVKFWRLDIIFLWMPPLSRNKSVLLGWRDTKRKKVNTRINKKVNALPEESLIDPRHIEQLEEVSVPYRSYAQHEGILVLDKISQDWEGSTVPLIIEKSTKKAMGLLESMGMDLDKLKVLGQPQVRDEVGSGEVGGSSESQRPSKEIISFSPEHAQYVGFDGSSLRSYTSLPADEESDQALAEFLAEPPTNDSSVDHSRGTKRTGEDLANASPKCPMTGPPPTSPSPTGVQGFTSSSLGSSSRSGLKFTHADLEKLLKELGPMTRASFHCTAYPMLLPVTNNKWEKLRSVCAHRLGYDNSTRSFSFLSLRAGSTVIPHPTAEFQKGLRNDYFVSAPSIRLKDDIRNPDVARRYADAMVPPIWAAEASFSTPEQLAGVYDAVAAYAFVSGAVMRESLLAKSKMLTGKNKDLEAKLKVVSDDLSKDRKEKQVLEEDTKSKLAEKDRKLEDERARAKELALEVERLTQLRRDTLSAFPHLFRLVLDHPDVMTVLGDFNKAAYDLGRHSAAMELSQLHPSINPTSLPFYDSSVVVQAEKANAAFEKKSFPILDAIVKSPDASIEDIISLISSSSSNT